MATLLEDMGKPDEARPLYEEALQAQQGDAGRPPPGHADLDLQLGRLLEKQGKIAEAIPLFTEELEGCVSLHGMAHEETRDSAKHLVKLLRNADQQDEADGTGRKVRRVTRVRPRGLDATTTPTPTRTAGC